MKFHLGHEGHRDKGKSERRPEPLGRVSRLRRKDPLGERGPGRLGERGASGRGGRGPERTRRRSPGWRVARRVARRGQGRAGRGLAARGLRAAGGGLSHGGDSRSRAPCLSGDTATSGDGLRRPGMAAWSPAAAAPLLRGIRGLPLLHCAQRMFASQTEGELKVTQILKEKFPRATVIKVTDISGGCGAMYEIQIESEEFKEKRTVQQHRMVNQALKEEIKGMHGLRIFTSVPKH
uniref:BolA-like protein 3 n=2 Tax=Equus TaxID=9789 RepID=A0A8C4MA71_EQUAS